MQLKKASTTAKIPSQDKLQEAKKPANAVQRT